MLFGANTKHRRHRLWLLGRFGIIAVNPKVGFPLSDSILVMLMLISFYWMPLWQLAKSFCSNKYFYRLVLLSHMFGRIFVCKRFSHFSVSPFFSRIHRVNFGAEVVWRKLKVMWFLVWLPHRRIVWYTLYTSSMKWLRCIFLQTGFFWTTNGLDIARWKLRFTALNIYSVRNRLIYTRWSRMMLARPFIFRVFLKCTGINSAIIYPTESIVRWSEYHHWNL